MDALVEVLSNTRCRALCIVVCCGLRLFLQELQNHVFLFFRQEVVDASALLCWRGGSFFVCNRYLLLELWRFMDLLRWKPWGWWGWCWFSGL